MTVSNEPLELRVPMQFGMKIGHIHTYKFCEKCCLLVNNYKYGDGANV